MTIDASAVARVTGIDTQFVNLQDESVQFLPQQIGIFAQGTTVAQASYSNDKVQITSHKQVGDTYGYGSPAHLIARELFPDNGDGVGTIPVTLYPLDDDGSAVTAAGDITPSGTATEAGTYRIRVGGILSAAITIPVGAVVVATFIADAIAAIAAVLEHPTIGADGTTKLNVTAKWGGASANELEMEVIGPSVGVAFAITQLTGGATNPDVTTALGLIGDTWETLLINAMEFDDAVTLGIFSTVGEGRWDQLVRRPFVAFVGARENTVALATAVTATRTTDRVSCQLVAPDSVDAPFRIAARQVVFIAKLANNNPPHDYGSQQATGLLPGLDGFQWDYAERDQAVKAGSSTVEIKDGIVNLSDIVTMYAPAGEVPPAYRYVVDIVKVMQIIYNLDLIFNTAEWDGAPLIPDNQATVNPTAKTPKAAKAEVNGLIDALALQAILSDPKTAKKNTTAVINSSNPKRLDIRMKVQISGNVNIKDLLLEWGFFFG